MRWKLGKSSFSQNETPIFDKKSMAFDTNEKTASVFTITQLTPAIESKTTIELDNTSSITHEKYKPQTDGDFNYDAATASTTRINSSGTQTTKPSQIVTTSHHRAINNTESNNNHHHQNVFKRRSSLEEALKFCYQDTIEDGNDNDNACFRINDGNIFVISSNQIDHVTPSWSNQHHHHQNPQHNYSISSNLASSKNISIVNNDGDDNNENHQQTIINKTYHMTEIPNTHHNINSISNGNINSNTTNIVVLENNYVNEVTNDDYHYANSIITTPRPSSTGSLINTKTSSTTKLLPNTKDDDQSSTQAQSKCSYFGGLILCLCFNVTYTNIVRFPRELDQYGTAYLIPYFLILFLVGLPIILLEVSIGQFLGQGAAHTWRSSPIFKGASVISRFTSWLATIWISMQAALAILYIGMLTFKSVPFSECASGVKLIAESGYKENGKDGQECIQKTFLTPVWVDAQFFGFLALGLVILWLISLTCTYNAKVFRRISFFTGIIGFLLLISLSGWEVYLSLGIQYFPQLWSFDETFLLDSRIWFSALVQVIYSTNIGFGIVPVVTGKFLHKNDALRTTILYFCFNLLINALSVILFMVQFDNIVTRNSDNSLAELKPLTAVYDKVLNENDLITTRVIPGIIYALFVISAIVSISLATFTASRLVPRHPSYVLNLLGLISAIMAIIAPKYIISRILDSRLIGTLVITSLVFDLIATTWIYGVKNIRTDLEFSIGRSIYVFWLILWCISPLILSGVLIWWCLGDAQNDLLYTILPRWSPIVFVVIIILIISCIQIFKQVDYNFFGMICEAAKPAKEWGPADPLARHAWKQWRSVCEDTGRKDFTLRRRGTRDYTHSIKKGQYSSKTPTNKYGTGTGVISPTWKSSTPGNSSPNYSGSMFGDSAIEEDMSVDKYSSGIDHHHHHHFTGFSSSTDNNIVYKPSLGGTGRHSNRSRKFSHEKLRHNSSATSADRRREIIYIRKLSNDRTNATKIEITPTNENIVYSNASESSHTTPSTVSVSNNHNRFNRVSGNNNNNNNDSKDTPVTENNSRAYWRKFPDNSEEFSTEL